MGITIFKFVIWGGISSDIRSEIMFYGSALNKISDRISDDIPPQMKNLNTVIPLVLSPHCQVPVYTVTTLASIFQYGHHNGKCLSIL